MKFFIQLLLVVLPLSICHAGFDAPHVIVFGTAEKKVVPDELHWALSVKTIGPAVAEVSKMHIDDVSRVLSYLKNSGLSEKDVKTTRMQLNENRVYRNNSRVKEGYFALTQITFELSDFAGYLEYWEQLANFNNLTINSVTFALSNREDVKDKVRVSAVKNAREKAVSLADALGAKLMPPLLIEELDSYSPRPQKAMLSMEMADSGTAGGISPGYEIVQARVRVLFEIAER